jgi:glycerol-3-phosphate dehydrogenase
MEVGVQRGVTGLELWNAQRLRREEPNLSHDILEALYAPTAAVVNPYEACFMLAECAARGGVSFRFERQVTRLSKEESGFVITVRPTFDDAAEEEQLTAHFVVNAAGLFADVVADMVGAGGFTIRARKGEEYLLDKRLDGYVKRIIFPCPTPASKGILIIPTYDGTLMVGPTASWADKDDLTTTAEGGAEVFQGARKLAPGISEADTIAEFAGLRAVADGEEFILGPSRVAGFVHAAGMQSPALTAAPAVALRVLEALRDDGLELQARHDFEPTVAEPVRFATLSHQERRALISRDPSYARMVCRCEVVTEGEVRDAIERGARTLDGLKFRTRVGMGRCQGGFCQWPCIEMLSEAQGVALHAITKNGGASFIAFPRPELPPEPQGQEVGA